MEVVVLKMFLAIASAMLITLIGVAGTLTYHGIKIYLLVKRENKKKTL